MTEEKKNQNNKHKTNLYIALFSIHGLIRGQNMELGRDADTGGQILYAVDLAKKLIEHPDVAQVDLFTRQIIDPKVSEDYAQPQEELAPGARIVRLPAGPKRYLRKEVLWPYITMFSDQALYFFRKEGRIPDLIHGHYADAGQVSSLISSILGVPLVFTGHSLGRIKLKRLLSQGMERRTIEDQYRISQRIEAEEVTLDYADFIVASTHQEIEEQYKIYDNYEPKRMVVIPPGVDLSRFSPPQEDQSDSPIQQKIKSFLIEPDKPLILAMSRPDPRKNIETLVKAYGESEQLQQTANLAIIAGTREDISAMENTSRKVMTNILLLIDKYNLYGKVAYPKAHQSDEVPEIYKLVTKTGGAFVNPALTEPFGLTLLEAAASGAPLVATNDGGPNDILGQCQNGLFIDPMDSQDIADKLLKALSDKEQWRQWSENGKIYSKKYFSWEAHIEKYLEHAREVMKKRAFQYHNLPNPKSKIPTANRFLICDVDNTLIGGKSEEIAELFDRIKNSPQPVGFGLATGRTLQNTLPLLEEWDIPMPDILITSVGTEIYYAPNLSQDKNWEQHIRYRWKPKEIHDLLYKLPGLIPQKKDQISPFKISYHMNPQKAPKVKEIKKIFRNSNLHVSVQSSFQMFLDILPVRASKGSAIRYIAWKWGINMDNILAIGDSGNDASMLRGETLGVVVGNHSKELNPLKNRPRIYFSPKKYTKGILDGIDYYNFLGEQIRIPNQ